MPDVREARVLWVAKRAEENMRFPSEAADQFVAQRPEEVLAHSQQHLSISPGGLGEKTRKMCPVVQLCVGMIRLRQDRGWFGFRSGKAILFGVRFFSSSESTLLAHGYFMLDHLYSCRFLFCTHTQTHIYIHTYIHTYIHGSSREWSKQAHPT